MRKYLFIPVVLMLGCYPAEEPNVSQKEYDLENMTELDWYIEENFTQKYGIAVRYRYVDNYLNPGQRTTPPRVDAVRPMLDFIEDYWIAPYEQVENGADFFANHVPAEVVLFGGLIYQGNSVLLGVAEAGARISLLNVNAVDPDDQDWILFQLGTIYHEFAHIVHQRYKLPSAFETISPSGYTSPGSWYTLTDDQAIARGFVSPYGTSSPNEDYAEIVAHYLFDPEFHETFTIDEENCDNADCEEKNEGRALIRQKLASIAEHHEKSTGVNLQELREATQSIIVK